MALAWFLKSSTCTLALGLRSFSSFWSWALVHTSLGASKVVPAPCPFWRFDQPSHGTTELQGSIKGPFTGSGHSRSQGPQNTPAQGMALIYGSLVASLPQFRFTERTVTVVIRGVVAWAPGRRTMQ